MSQSFQKHVFTPKLCCTKCLLSTVHCLLSTVYCLLSTVYFLLSTVYCLLSTLYSLLSTVCCLLFTFYCLHHCNTKTFSDRNEFPSQTKFMSQKVVSFRQTNLTEKNILQKTSFHHRNRFLSEFSSEKHTEKSFCHRSKLIGT